MMEENRIRLCLSEFLKNSPTSDDQPQARVANYSLNSEEIPGQIIDWVTSYFDNSKCSFPYSLVLAIAKEVAHHVSASFADIACNATEEELEKYSHASNMYAGTIGKISEICSSFLEKSDLDIGCSEKIYTTSVFAIKNKRRKMEDRHVAIPDLNSLLDLKDLPQHSYYAVFDGHSGSDAACYTAAQLHVNIAKHPDFMIDTPKAIVEAYRITDLNFLNKCNKGNIKSGCTALSALIRGSQVYLSWLGDSLAVLVKESVPLILTNPHKPDREDERSRIEKLGGNVTLHGGTWRVGGLLAVSRAIGDPEQKPYISSEPELVTINLEGTEDFLILACDGLWDGMSPEDATAVLYRYFLDNPSDESLDAVAAKLVHQSKLQGSEDNITAIVIFLRNAKDIRENAEKFLNNSNIPVGDFLSLNGNVKSPDTDVHLSKPTVLELNSTSAKKLKNTANVMSSAGFGLASFDYQHMENMETSFHSSDYLLGEDESAFISQQKVGASYVAPEATALSELPTPPIDDILSSQQDDNFYATDLYKEISSVQSFKPADLSYSPNKHNLSSTNSLPTQLIDTSNMSLSDTQTSPNSSVSSKISSEEAVKVASTVVTTTVETAVKCLTEETSDISPVSQLNPYAKPFVMKSFICTEENMINKKDESPVVPVDNLAKVSEKNLPFSESLSSPVNEAYSPDKNSSPQATNLLNKEINVTDEVKIKQIEIGGSGEPESVVSHEDLLSLAPQTCSVDNIDLSQTIENVSIKEEEYSTISKDELTSLLEDTSSLLSKTCSNESNDIGDTVKQFHEKIDSTHLENLSQIEQSNISNLKTASLLNEELSSFVSESHFKTTVYETSSLEFCQNPKPEIQVVNLASNISNQCDSSGTSEDSILLMKNMDTNIGGKNSDLIQLCSDLISNSNEVCIEKESEECNINFPEKLPVSDIHPQDMVSEVNSLNLCEDLKAQIHTAELSESAANLPVGDQNTNENVLMKCVKDETIKASTDAGISEKTGECVEKTHSNSSESITKEFSLTTTGNEVVSITSDIPSDPSIEDSQVEAVAVDLKSLPENIPEAEGVTEDSDSEKDGGWSYVKGNTVSSSKSKSAEKKTKTEKSSLQKNIAAANFKKNLLKPDMESKSKVKTSPMDKSKNMIDKTRSAALTNRIKASVPDKTKSTTPVDTIKRTVIDKKTEAKNKVAKSSTLVGTKTSNDKFGKIISVKTETTEVSSKTIIQKPRLTTLLHTNKTTTKILASVPAKPNKVGSAVSESKVGVKPVASNNAAGGTQSKTATLTTTSRNVSNKPPTTVPNKTLKATTSSRTVSSRLFTTTNPSKTAQTSTSTGANAPPTSAPNKRNATTTTTVRHASLRPATTLPSRTSAKPRPASVEPRPRIPLNRPSSTLKKPDVKEAKNDVNKQISAKRNTVSNKTESSSTLTTKRVTSVNNKSAGNKTLGSAIKSEPVKKGMPKVAESKTIKKTSSKITEANIKTKTQSKTEETLNHLNTAIDQKVTTETVQSAEEKFVLETSNKEIASNEGNQNTASEIIIQETEEKFILETSTKEIVNEKTILDQQGITQLCQGLQSALILEPTNKNIEEKPTITENGCLSEFESAAPSTENL